MSISYSSLAIRFRTTALFISEAIAIALTFRSCTTCATALNGIEATRGRFASSRARLL